MMFEIRSRWTENVLFSLECESMKACVEAAVKSRADLSGADLSRADLSRADLSGADLSGADLSGADLSGAYLSRADLSGADLFRAYLSGANLSGADLSRADLSGADLFRAYLSRADLSQADLSWQSHDLLAEILMRDAADDTAKRSFAGLIMISRDWCWGTWLKLEVTAEVRWAASVLAKWIQPTDTGEHIDAIKRLASEHAADVACEMEEVKE